MDFIPEATFGFYNAWILTLVYGIFSILVMAFLPKERRKRIVTFPKFNSKIEKIAVGLTSFIYGRRLFLYQKGTI